VAVTAPQAAMPPAMNALRRHLSFLCASKPDMSEESFTLQSSTLRDSESLLEAAGAGRKLGSVVTADAHLTRREGSPALNADCEGTLRGGNVSTGK
jgi:hypothetical protein